MDMLQNSVKWEDLDFNEFDVYGDEINLGYDYQIKVFYECVFMSKYIDNYDGFIYDGHRFIECSNGGESVMFDSLQKIKDILDRAKEYWDETDLLAITKYIDIEKDDELIVGLHTQYKYVRV
jgi:hypothetical protein